MGAKVSPRSAEFNDILPQRAQRAQRKDPKCLTASGDFSFTAMGAKVSQGTQSEVNDITTEGTERKEFLLFVG